MIQEIYDRLKVWREKNGITVESQQDGYLANIMLEIGEVGAELQANNDAGVMAELCDCLIIAMNCYGGNRSKLKDLEFYNYYAKFDLKWTFHKTINWLSVFGGYRFINSDLNTLTSYIKEIIKNLGFDFNKAMDETLKKIESREGYWDKDKNKWIKTATHYKPDYESCRLKQ